MYVVITNNIQSFYFFMLYIEICNKMTIIIKVIIILHTINNK
jgi:hypothetical protein